MIQCEHTKESLDKREFFKFLTQLDDYFNKNQRIETLDMFGEEAELLMHFKEYERKLGKRCRRWAKP